MVKGFARSGRLPIVVALDPPIGVDPVKWCLGIIDDTLDIVSGYKIGLPLILDLDRKRDLEKILGKMESVWLRIADLKLADIGDIMVSVIRRLHEFGFNAFIVHGFIGYNGALDHVSDYLNSIDAKLITIVSMSHSGSSEIIDHVLDRLLEAALKASSWGIIAPATRPEIIREIRSRVGDRVKILSPGIGVQGARPSTAIKAGADYEIIGRLVTRSEDPRKTLLEIRDLYR